MLPTLLAAAGEPDINQKLLNGYKAGDKTFNVCIDGINQLPYLTGQVKESPRDHFFYVSDDGGVMAVRARRHQPAFRQTRSYLPKNCVRAYRRYRLPHIYKHPAMR